MFKRIMNSEKHLKKRSMDIAKEKTRHDLVKEKQMLDGAHNLDFMMEDGELM